MSIQLCLVTAVVDHSKSALCSPSMKHCAPARLSEAWISRKTRSSSAKRWRHLSGRRFFGQVTNSLSVFSESCQKRASPVSRESWNGHIGRDQGLLGLPSSDLE